MASFELGEELRKMFFRLVTSVGQRKTSFLILQRAQNLPSLLFCQKHEAINIADPSSMQDACH